MPIPDSSIAPDKFLVLIAEAPIEDFSIEDDFGQHNCQPVVCGKERERLRECFIENGLMVEANPLTKYSVGIMLVSG